MGLITWDKALETGHPKVDEQHKALIEAFNNLHQAMKSGKGKETIGKTLDFLKDYTVQHFQMEEGLMDANRYPGAPKHKELHRDLVAKVADLVERFHSGQPVLTMAVMNFLEGWLMEHIQGEDVLLAKFIKDKS
jgi:hemerythrin-like metal-binding protein